MKRKAGTPEKPQVLEFSVYSTREEKAAHKKLQRSGEDHIQVFSCVLIGESLEETMQSQRKNHSKRLEEKISRDCRGPRIMTIPQRQSMTHNPWAIHKVLRRVLFW